MTSRTSALSRKTKDRLRYDTIHRERRKTAIFDFAFWETAVTRARVSHTHTHTHIRTHTHTRTRVQHQRARASRVESAPRGEAQTHGGSGSTRSLCESGLREIYSHHCVSHGGCARACNFQARSTKARRPRRQKHTQQESVKLIAPAAALSATSSVCSRRR